MTGSGAAAAHPPALDEAWLSLLYQVPVGVIVCDDAGVVEVLNPAAVRMLLPAVPPGADLQRLFPVLNRVAPGLVGVISQDRHRRGRLDPARRVVVPAGTGRTMWCELVTTRVDDDRVLVTVLDVTEEHRLATREHEIAVELQRSMVGRIDPVPGLPVGVFYRSAAEQMAVGGDWYDVVALPHDRVALVIGDVCGHNLAATAVMGQLRSAVRALAAYCNGPAELLERVGDFARTVEGAACSTVVCAELDRRRGLLTYSCAGHPPPLLLRAGEAPRLLPGGRHAPLACPTPRRPVQDVEQLEPADTVVLYTDGLVERRDTDVTDGLDRLLAAAAGLTDVDTAELGVRLVDALVGDVAADDDVCVLAVGYPDAARRSVAGGRGAAPRFAP